MHCFICMTYMIFICTAHPSIERKVSRHERSLFHDVIESLRIRSQLPEDFNQNEENNLSQNYERYGYGYENEGHHLPSDNGFIPRRNDRIEMPSLKYRVPKSLGNNNSGTISDNPKKEIVLYISTTKEPKLATQKPKRQKRPPPTNNKNKTNKNDNDNEEVVDEIDTEKPEELIPFTNNMAGQSQIGNRDSQMVVKPTVIVNIRGSVHHQDSDIKIEGRKKNDTTSDIPKNIFNIKQEIKLVRPLGRMGSNEGQNIKEARIKQEVKTISEEDKERYEEDMMMCETATWNPQKNKREVRQVDNILQIMFSL